MSMAGLSVKLCLITLSILCVCSSGTRTYLCRTNRAVGYCKLREECSQLSNGKYKSVEDNKDCKNSNLIGDVVCCVKNTKIYSEKQKAKSVDLDLKFYRGNQKPKSVNLNRINPEGLSLLNQNNCGHISDFRIANGVNAILGEFPWMAILLNANRTPFCDGSIITDRYILTAAHCITDDLRFVRLGEHNLITEEDCLPHHRSCRRYMEFDVDPERRPISHPEFDESTYYKDIALIKIKGVIDFSRYNHIKPICLPTSEILSHNETLVLAGWGSKENNQKNDVLQKGDLIFVTEKECKKIYKRRPIKSKICATAGVNQTVSCRGDSGAPLFGETEYKSGEYTLVRYTQFGLVSLGYQSLCGESTSFPYLYENVKDSMSWITHTILT